MSHVTKQIKSGLPTGLIGGSKRGTDERMRGLWTRAVTRPRGKTWTQYVLESELHKDCFVVLALHKGFAPRRAAAMTSWHLTESLCETDKGGQTGEQETQRNHSVPWHQASRGASHTSTYIPAGSLFYSHLENRPVESSAGLNPSHATVLIKMLNGEKLLAPCQTHKVPRRQCWGS